MDNQKIRNWYIDDNANRDWLKMLKRIRQLRGDKTETHSLPTEPSQQKQIGDKPMTKQNNIITNFVKALTDLVMVSQQEEEQEQDNCGCKTCAANREEVGKKVGRFITTEGRVIFVGGPGQGSGGSGGGGGTTAKTAEQIAEELLSKSMSVEPRITEIVTSTVDKVGGEMEGLDYRIKSGDSLIRKIKSESEDCECPEEEAASVITDIVRYTAVFDPDNLVDGVQETQAALANDGWTQYDEKFRNYFTSEGPYRGYNTVYTNGKQTFELQFHTRQSLQIKERVHELYERARVLPKGKERTRLVQQMTNMWSSFENPAKYSDLPGVQMP